MKNIAFIIFILIVLSKGAFALATDSLVSDFRKADSIAVSYPRHSLQNLKILSDKLTKSLTTEEEKFRAIYKWVCLNIDYDYSLHLRNQQKRAKLKNDKEALHDWNRKIGKEVITTLLEKRRTVCTGYAYLLKELATYAGINCVVIDGYGRTAQSNIGGEGIVNHSWNAVQLHNNWYLCDATWSAGSYDTQLFTYVKKYDNAYFLANPSLFIRNHFPLDTSMMLLKDKPTLHDFLNRPLIYATIYRYQITKLLPETFQVEVLRGEKFSIAFDLNNGSVVDKVELSINTPGGIQSFHPALYQPSAGLHGIDHTFTQKGIHTIHVLLNDEYVCTYTVKVK